MYIKIICIFVLYGFSLSEEYDAKMVPMKKESKYGNDVCSYTDDKQKYVKICEKGKFCDTSSIIETLDYSRGKYEDESSLEICQELPNATLFSNYKESCVNDFECEQNYKCIGNTCSYKCNNANEFYYISYDGSNGCISNSDKGTDGVCYEETRKKGLYYAETQKYSPPVANKICGKLSFIDDLNDDKKGIYYVGKSEYVYEGEVEDGEYVTDEKLCKSGFALFFFKGGNDPKEDSASGTNQMFLRCVTPISITSKITETPPSSPSSPGDPSVPAAVTVDDCSINYKINEDGEILRYNIHKLDTSKIAAIYLGHNIVEDYCKSDDKLYIKLKHEKYREFYTNLTEEERKTCGDLDYANQYSCENNELIRSWYFYKHPKDFATYNDRKKIGKVIDYKIQKKYPCYSLSQFLIINYIYLLFLLLI